MNARRLFGITKRILRQLRHDHRTLALVVVAPCLLMTILKWIYSDNGPVFQRVSGSLLGIFPMLIMFLITSVATLRERTSGTLERLLISPLTKLEFIFGYAISFGLLALSQGVIVSTYATQVLNLSIARSQLLLIWIAVIDALVGMAIGLLVSSFAKTEFQALQFMPAILLPQLLISGLLVPREQMPPLLYEVSNFLPLSYAADATRKVLSSSDSIMRDSLILIAFILGLLAVGSLTLKRISK